MIDGDVMMFRNRQSGRVLAVSLFAGLCLAMIAGCGDGIPRRYPVSGTVKFPDGEPVRTGIVEFLSEDRKFSATGYIDRSGSFQLTTVKNNDGAVLGKHSVIIKQFILMEAGSDVVHDHGRIVDERYAKYENELLHVTIGRQSNIVEFEVLEQTRKN